jgi:hypothetical protein
MMNDNPDDIRPPFIQRATRFIAKSAIGVAAEKAIEKTAEKIYDVVAGAVKGADMASPVATAPLPPPLPSAPRLRQTPRFDWPIDRASSARIAYINPAMLFDLPSDGTERSYIKAAASGTVTAVFSAKRQFLEPMFGIFIRHSENLHSLYWGWGTSVVRHEILVKKSQNIARLVTYTHWLYFEMAQGQKFIDPRPYFPLLPRVSEVEGHRALLMPAVMELWLWRCEVLMDPKNAR